MRTPVDLLRYWVDLSAVGASWGDANDDREAQGIDRAPRPGADEKELFAAWARLAHVAELTQETARDVATVLGGTIVYPHVEPPSLPSLAVEPAPERPRATAAHPRAYQGTKKQPPKPSRSEPVDLRPYLCSARGVEEVTEELGKLEGGAPVALDSVHEAWTAPAGLRMAMGVRWREGWTSGMRREAETLWRQTGGEGEALRSAQAAAVSARVGGPLTLQYLRCVAAVLPEHRGPVAHGLLESHSYAAFQAFPPEAIAELALIAAGADKGHELELASWVRLLCCSPVSEHSAVLAGARLAARFGHGASVAIGMSASEQAAEFLLELLTEWSTHGSVDYTFRALDVWALLGDSPDLAPVYRRMLACVRSQELDMSILDSWWHYLRCFSHTYESERRRAFVKHIDRILDAVISCLPAWQGKAWDLFYHVTWEDRPGAAAAMERMPAVIKRWCAALFSTSSRVREVLWPLAVVKDEDWNLLMDAPDASMRALESACQRGNDAALMAHALENAVGVDSGWTVAQMAERPKVFARLLRVLGVLSGEQQRGLLRDGLARYGAAPAESIDLRGFVEHLDALPLPTGAHPVSSRVRQHIDGGSELTPGQIERQLVKLRSGWPDVVLACLRADALRALATSVLGEAPSGGEELAPEEIERLPGELIHALLLQSQLDDNRRSLRRMIRAVFHGDESYLARHPQNQRWMAQLAEEVSAEAAQVWRSPPTVTVEVEGLGRVTLGPEHRPLEALRMGTYVGSCYGLGGSFRYAAAAVVLDVNKQVVFARREDGSFLARQIVGVSDAWTLHCCYVYPDQNDGPLLEAFLDYDRELAAACGMSLAGSDEEDDESVLCLVSMNSWEEGVVFDS